MSGKYDAKQIKSFALEPVGRRPDFNDGIDNRKIVIRAERPYPQAQVIFNGQQMVDDGETLLHTNRSTPCAAGC